MGKKKTLKISIVLVVVALVALAFYWKISTSVEQRKEALDYQGRVHDVSRRPVTVVRVEKRPIISHLEITGTLTPISVATISAKISGTIVKFDAEEGDVAREGDIVAELDKDELQSKLEQARASLTQAQAAREEAVAAMNNAKGDWERKQNIYKEGIISKQELDNQEKAYKVAVAKVSQAEAAIKAAEASVENAKVYLDYATIKAPIDGIITEKYQHLGDTTSPGKPLFKLECIRQVKAETRVNEDDMKYVEKGKRTEVAVDAIEGKEFTGDIIEIIPSADPDIRSFTIKVLLENTDLTLKPGMFARIRIVKEKKDAALAVPGDSVYVRDGIEYLYVVRDDTAHLTPVKLGIRSGDMVEVTEGATEGETVVLTGIQALEDGAKVETERQSGK